MTAKLAWAIFAAAYRTVDQSVEEVLNAAPGPDQDEKTKRCPL